MSEPNPNEKANAPEAKAAERTTPSTTELSGSTLRDLWIVDITNHPTKNLLSMFEGIRDATSKDR